MSRPLILGAALALTLLAACGSQGSAGAARARPARGSEPALRSPAGSAAARGRVAAALRANHELSVAVLWADHVPASARRSTRGPALAAMRASASERRQAGLRVRMLSERYRIVSIRLDRSRTSATAVVVSEQKLVPSRLDGSARGGAVELEERARIELRRIGSPGRFLVWRLTLEQ